MRMGLGSCGSHYFISLALFGRYVGALGYIRVVFVNMFLFFWYGFVNMVLSFWYEDRFEFGFSLVFIILVYRLI